MKLPPSENVVQRSNSQPQCTQLKIPEAEICPRRSATLRPEVLERPRDEPSEGIAVADLRLIITRIFTIAK
jgi:hypothetical protein